MERRTAITIEKWLARLRLAEEERAAWALAREIAASKLPLRPMRPGEEHERRRVQLASEKPGRTTITDFASAEMSGHVPGYRPRRNE